MKKTLSIFALAAAAVFAVSCCGNGKADEASVDLSAIDPEAIAEIMEITEAGALVAAPVEEIVEEADSAALAAAAAAVEAIDSTLAAAASEAAEAVEAAAEEAVEAAEEAAPAAPAAVVEVKPTFEGGDALAFQKWVQANLKYPQTAIENNEAGKVLVSFVVNKKGKVTNAKVLKGVSEALDAEALRVVSSSPDWAAGATRDGKKVDVAYVLPVIFALN